MKILAIALSCIIFLFPAKYLELVKGEIPSPQGGTLMLQARNSAILNSNSKHQMVPRFWVRQSNNSSVDHIKERVFPDHSFGHCCFDVYTGFAGSDNGINNQVVTTDHTEGSFTRIENKIGLDIFNDSGSFPVVDHAIEGKRPYFILKFFFGQLERATYKEPWAFEGLFSNSETTLGLASLINGGLPQSVGKTRDDESDNKGEKPIVAVNEGNAANSLSNSELDDEAVFIGAICGLLGGYFTYALTKLGCDYILRKIENAEKNYKAKNKGSVF